MAKRARDSAVSSQDSALIADSSQPTAILPPSAVRQRESVYRELFEAGLKALQFHSLIWAEDEEQTTKRREYMNRHKAEFHARERSARLLIPVILNMVKPVQSSENSDKPDVIDVDKLEEMNLSDDELKKLAGKK